MVFTALTTIFTSFTVFRAIYDKSLTGFIPNVVNVTWSFYYLAFLIAAIFMADSTTSSVCIYMNNIRRTKSRSFNGFECGLLVCLHLNFDLYSRRKSKRILRFRVVNFLNSNENETFQRNFLPCLTPEGCLHMGKMKRINKTKNHKILLIRTERGYQCFENTNSFTIQIQNGLREEEHLEALYEDNKIL